MPTEAWVGAGTRAGQVLPTVGAKETSSSETSTSQGQAAAATPAASDRVALAAAKSAEVGVELRPSTGALGSAISAVHVLRTTRVLRVDGQRTRRKAAATAAAAAVDAAVARHFAEEAVSRQRIAELRAMIRGLRALNPNAGMRRRDSIIGVAAPEIIGEAHCLAATQFLTMPQVEVLYAAEHKRECASRVSLTFYIATTIAVIIGGLASAGLGSFTLTAISNTPAVPRDHALRQRGYLAIVVLGSAGCALVPALSSLCPPLIWARGGTPIFAYQLAVCAGVLWACAFVLAFAGWSGIVFAEEVPVLCLLVLTNALHLRASNLYAVATGALVLAGWVATASSVGAAVLGPRWYVSVIRSGLVLCFALFLTGWCGRTLDYEGRKAFLVLSLLELHLRQLEEQLETAPLPSSDGTPPGLRRRAQPAPGDEEQALGALSSVHARTACDSISSSIGSPGGRCLSGAVMAAALEARDGQGRPAIRLSPSSHPHVATTAWAGQTTQSSADSAAASAASHLAAASGSPPPSQRASGSADSSADGLVAVDPGSVGDSLRDSRSEKSGVVVDLESPLAKIQALLAQISHSFDLSPEETALFDEAQRALSSAGSIWAPNLDSQLRGSALDTDVRSWLFYEVAKESGGHDAGAGVRLSRARPPSQNSQRASHSSGVAAADSVAVLSDLGFETAEDAQLLLLGRPGLCIEPEEVLALREVRGCMASWELELSWKPGQGPDSSARMGGIHTLHDRCGSRLMAWVLLSAFESYGLLQLYRVPDPVFAALLEAIEHSYFDVPYHCLLHAVDALHSTFWLLKHGGVDQGLEKVHVMAMLLAAASHDIGHPGKNNAYHAATRSHLALLYNDRSILENMHASTTIRLLSRPEFEPHIMGKLSPEEGKAMREIMVETILATDLAVHFENLGKYTAQQAQGFDLKRPADRNLKLSVLVHLADVATPSKTWGAYRRWLPRLFQEFFDQGDIEAQSGLPVAPFMDRRVPTPAKSQLGFCQFIVQPLFEAVIVSVPLLEEKLDHVGITMHFLNLWQELGPPPRPSTNGAAVVDLETAYLPEIFWDPTTAVLTTDIIGGNISVAGMQFQPAVRETAPSVSSRSSSRKMSLTTPTPTPTWRLR